MSSSREYIDEGKFDDGAYKISLYEKGMWLMTYKGYISRYNPLEMKLYPKTVGTGVSSDVIPGKHGILIFEIKKGR